MSKQLFPNLVCQSNMSATFSSKKCNQSRPELMQPWTTKCSQHPQKARTAAILGRLEGNLQRRHPQSPSTIFLSIISHKHYPQNVKCMHKKFWARPKKTTRWSLTFCRKVKECLKTISLSLTSRDWSTNSWKRNIKKYRCFYINRKRRKRKSISSLKIKPSTFLKEDQ